MSSICELRNITKSYGDHVIFDHLDLSIEEGEMVCIAGRSGCGKSTLLNLIGMFDKPDSGDIQMFGQALPSINSKAGRMLMQNRLFYCFQNFALIDNETIDYNLEIPLLHEKLSKQEKARKKQEALAMVGIDKSLREKIFRLSGGEQQRVALARAFLRKFDLMLADEPTGSLDGANRERILDIFETLHKEGKTMIIVSHDPEVMKRCERVVEL